MDSGTTYHLTADLDNLVIHSEYQGSDEFTIGNGSRLPTFHISNSSLSTSSYCFILDDILHMPTASQNILSGRCFVKSNNASIEFFLDFFVVKDLATNAVLYKWVTRERLYVLPVVAPPSSFVSASSASSSKIRDFGVWHARLGHASAAIVRKIFYCHDFVSSNSSLCQACAVSKIHKLPFSLSACYASGPLDLICSDVWDPAPIPSNDGFPYYVLFFYHFSKYTWIYFLK
jgi:hypothetical protein